MFDTGRKKKKEEAELDITPMIDVTFLLLIFFMVTSTMQGTPDKDLPPTKEGETANAAAYLDLTVLAPASAGVDSEITFNDKVMSLEELKSQLVQEASLSEIKLMIYAERDVKTGFIGELESVINEVEGEITYDFAVRDLR